MHVARRIYWLPRYVYYAYTEHNGGNDVRMRIIMQSGQENSLVKLHNFQGKTVQVILFVNHTKDNNYYYDNLHGMENITQLICLRTELIVKMHYWLVLIISIN